MVASKVYLRSSEVVNGLPQIWLLTYELGMINGRSASRCPPRQRTRLSQDTLNSKQSTSEDNNTTGLACNEIRFILNNQTTVNRGNDCADGAG